MHEIMRLLPDYDAALAAQVPPSTLAGLVRYATDQCPVGGFLTAVLSNDLTEAVFRADDINLPALKPIALFVYNCLPAPCHGSREAVKKWLEARVATPEAV